MFKIQLNSDYVMDCGRNVALLWGGECLGYDTNDSQSEYTFHCIEHGERFDTTLTFEMLEDYESHPYCEDYSTRYKK